MTWAVTSALAVAMGGGSLFASFPDVPPDHWAAPAVNELRQEGILRGYPPGAAPALSVAQRKSEFTDEDRLGSTVGQLLAMGRDAWLAYHAERQGQSTAAMAAAEAIFADALRVRNAENLAKASPATRNRVNRLRTSMRRYADRLIEAQRAITGGGTMWVNIEAGVATDLEQAIDGILRPNAYRPRPGGPRVLNQAAIEQGITRIAAQLRRERKDIDEMAPSSGMNTEQALASVAAARRELRGILESAKGPGERAVLRFAFDMTRLYGEL
ncbi:MAG: S-layer homology domain-containing protein [Fimbriimonadaceae bacterium]